MNVNTASGSDIDSETGGNQNVSFGVDVCAATVPSSFCVTTALLVLVAGSVPVLDG
jgi:hypothetical protein